MIKKFLNKLLGNPDAISFRQGLELTGLPIVTFHQGEKTFNFILDTGANQCCINKEIINAIDHTIINKRMNLHGIEGNKKVVAMCRIPLEYKDNTYEYNYMIVDLKEAFRLIKQDTGVTLHGILGSPFFNAYKYVIDFNELIAYSKA